MTISIDSGNTFLIFFAIVFAVIILIMLLKKGQLKQKIISLVIMITAFAAVYFFFGRPGELVADPIGLKSNTFGRINLEWADVQNAEAVENYEDSDWKPVVKLNGTAIPGFRTGKFRLANKQTARILTLDSEDAVVFRTDSEIFLIAVDEHDELLRYAAEYVNF